MEQVVKGFLVAAICVVASGCAHRVVLAPGAEQVQFIRNPADIAGCTAVGNVDWHEGAADLRNLTVGLGGNTVFVTNEGLFMVTRGIAYRCPK